MRKYFTFLLLVLFFVRCSENEERNPSSQGTGKKKPSYVKLHTEVRSRKAEIRGRKAEDKRARIEDRGSKIFNRIPPTSDLRPPDSKLRPRIIDTTMIRKLIRLYKSDQEIDLREPVSQTYFFSSIENPEFSSMILLSHDRSIRINFDNDIFDNTDRYYTNGIRFDFISPFLKQSPLSWLMVPYWGQGVNYYGVSIGQNMYTPYTTKVGGIHQGDRPYAAYLFIGSFKISNDQGKKFRQTSYALDRESREATLARLFEQSVMPASSETNERIAA